MNWTLLSLFIGLEWYSSCWLGTVSLTINLIVLQPTTHESAGAYRVSAHGSREEFLLARFPGGPTTDHPCSLPASPEASDADDVFRRCPLRE